MKLWIRILVIVTIIFALLFSATYLFIILKGRALLITSLSDLTQKKVTVGSFDLVPPFKLEIKNLNIEGLAKADYISVTPSIIGFILGRTALNEVIVIRPELTYEKLPPKPAQGISESSGSAQVKKTPPVIKSLIIKRVTIKNGRLDLIDRTVSNEGLKITFKDIGFTLNNAYLFPRSVITNFDLKGRIPWQDGQEEGKISFSGWLNFFKRDIKAALKIEDIDGVYLYPYYSSWMDLEKARIEKAKLNFKSDIEGVDNNLIAKCRLELTDIVRKPLSAEESEDKAGRIASAVLDIFRALNQGKIVLNFNIRTKMDRPEFGFANIKMAVEDKISKARGSGVISAQDIIAFPAKLMQGMFKGATDISKGLFDGASALGKELQKTAEETFRRESKP